MPKRCYAVLLFVALLGGCSSPTGTDDPGGGAAPPTGAELRSEEPDEPEPDSPQLPEGWSQERPATIKRSICPDNADCSFDVLFDDTFVGITCFPVIEGVTEEVVAVGSGSVPVREARAVAGVPPRLLVALANERGLCKDEAPWVAGIVSDLDRSLADELTLSIAACEVLGRPHRNEQECDWGGPAQHVTSSEGTMHVEFAWFPDVVAAANRDLAAGSGPVFRLDPAAVIADLERREFPACFEEHERLQVCRIGHTDLPTDPVGTVVVSGATQTRSPDVGFETSMHEWTLELLGDGPGWWVTSKTHRLDDTVSDGDADRRWERCCPEVITEIHSGVDQP